MSPDHISQSAVGRWGLGLINLRYTVKKRVLLHWFKYNTLGVAVVSMVILDAKQGL